MAICRCKDEKHQPKGKTHNYKYYAFPIGDENTAFICGRRKCKNPGVIYLTKSELKEFTKGERIFAFKSNSSKVKLEDKAPVMFGKIRNIKK
ncbi:MAG: hypothetical protein WCO54_00035 [Bacteroidota bacterium]